MLNQAYSIEKIIQNISQTTTISSLKKLFQANSTLNLSVHLESNLPISLCWDAKGDTFTGHQKITIFPKLVINGELYEASFKHDFMMPATFDGLEAAFMKTLKESIGTAQRVWGQS